MIAQIKDVITRSRATLIEDLAGVLVLFVSLYAVLGFSSF